MIFLDKYEYLLEEGDYVTFLKKYRDQAVNVRLYYTLVDLIKAHYDKDEKEFLNLSLSLLKELKNSVEYKDLYEELNNYLMNKIEIRHSFEPNFSIEPFVNYDEAIALEWFKKNPKMTLQELKDLINTLNLQIWEADEKGERFDYLNKELEYYEAYLRFLSR